MAEYNFVRKTLDTLFKVVEVELKVPLGFAEIKSPVTKLAKEWWENKKRDEDLKSAIRRAEESFIAAHPDNKLAQILHGFPLHSDEEFQNVIAGLLTHLEEDNITWLAGVKLEHEWDKLITREEIRYALELYLPFLRHELNSIKEFREIITARILEGLDKKADRIVQSTEKIDKTTERIEVKLDEALKSKQDKPITLNTGWFFGHRYGDLATFTGRANELKMLGEWLENDDDEALLMLRALGGFGKSALAWTWFNRVNREQWQTAVWWSFYEKESGFESFLAETLKHLGMEVKESARQQVNDLLETLRGTNILIVLDGFERLLRQYGRMDAALLSDDEDADIDPSQRDCSSPLTETFLRGLSGAGVKSKVLMTTRLCPRALESADGKLLKSCREERLATFSPEDAVEYFRRQGIKGTHAQVETVCEPYGYHPLSLSLLAGFIKTDLKKPFDIIAASQINVNEDIVARRHHVLEAVFNNLTFTQQLLIATLSNLGNSFDYEDIWKSRKKLPPYEDEDLRKLIQFGLVDFNSKEKQFGIHMIVRKYMVDRVPEDTFSSDLEKKPVLKIYPTSGPLGSKAQITGANFVPLDKVTIYIIPTGGTSTLLPISVEKDGTFQYIFDTLEIKGLGIGTCKFLGEGKASGNTKACSFQVTSSLHLKRPLRAFICYSKLDKKDVRELAGKLRAQGIDPWLDEEALLPGQDWEMEIEKAINNSDVIVTCFSNGSVKKPGYVNKELKLALDVADKQPEDTIFIIPLRLEDCPVPNRLNKWQYVNYFEPKGFEYLLRSLKYQANRLEIISK